jgi:hypothetical protein
MFAVTIWEGASFEKRELAAAPVRWLYDLAEGEIADILRFSRDQSLAEPQACH